MIKKTPNTLEFLAKNLTETERFGKVLARHLNPGDVVFLNGNLGAGKSILARATIRSVLDQPKLNVPSPTFLLALPYENEQWKILHADLYRIKNPEEIDELGLFEDTQTLVIIEWPEKAKTLLPHPTLNISLNFSSNAKERVLRITSAQGSVTFSSLATDEIFSQRDQLS
ncbi:MAG: tRNA (adenosine(37)-N6)-threonylcarbamoyltransferase complex ATPase subunit type 1 TsaE [Devosiaceae bacterium]|nr:tRNA (adenosine(37)-N6)-threonylcarbamoyltransferase complex ATPase subunit type 1 TsaE [Devosiaceae bacterium]